jgi:prepilin-type N-terminal cleavage/methylation domain-containing protein
MKTRVSGGFTLVELLVAMAILSIIVIICGRLFQQASAAWETGVRRAERNIIGRNLADFIAGDLSRAVARTDDELQIGATSLRFPIVDEASVRVVDEASVRDGLSSRAYQWVTYDLSPNNLRRNGQRLAPAGVVDRIRITAGPATPGRPPIYVDVETRVKDPDSFYVEVFTSRAWIRNRDRYRYDD